MQFYFCLLFVHVVEFKLLKLVYEQTLAEYLYTWPQFYEPFSVIKCQLTTTHTCLFMAGKLGASYFLVYCCFRVMYLVGFIQYSSLKRSLSCNTVWEKDLQICFHLCILFAQMLNIYTGPRCWKMHIWQLMLICNGNVKPLVGLNLPINGWRTVSHYQQR